MEEREIENENRERETSLKFMPLNALKILLIYEKSRTFFKPKIIILIILNHDNMHLWLYFKE